MTRADMLAVFRSWYLIEMLSPNGVKIEKKMLSLHTHAKANCKSEELPEMPWEVRQQELDLPDAVDEDGVDEPEGEVADGDAESERRVEGYIFYLGIVSLREAYEVIRAALKSEESFLDRESKANDYCALASVRLTLEGAAVPDSLTISTLPWYLGRIKAMGLERVLTEPVGREFEAFASVTRDAAFAASNAKFGSADLVALAELVVNACDATEIPWRYAFAGKIQKFDPKEPPGLLNSFFHEDIADAIGLLNKDQLPNLASTLFADSQSKFDVFRNEAHRNSVLQRKTISRSAWPSENALALMQQAAVSAADSPQARAITSVNGPPGTGKTTLLRSFIAGNVVKRAIVLASFEQPSAAWTHIREGTENEPPIYAIAEALTGFEMLVSSNNNGAIENITKDMPLEASVRGYEAALAEIDHFASVALNVANHDRETSEAIVRTWGLISAALGSKAKRSAFIEPLLHKADPGLTEGVETVHGFVGRGGHVGWSRARADFRAAYDSLAEHIGARDDRDSLWESLAQQEGQMRAPFVDPEIHEMQIDVFVKALALHRSFVQATWMQMSSNLTAWSNLARRPMVTDFTPDEATALWKSFFLLCPVVSTTFASARRMLAGVAWSSLGWALIDEAGQATPQSAMGVFLRCKRAIVVGDPLQLEPIVTLSPSIVRVIRETYGADPSYIASPDNGESLQTLADRSAVHGTWRPVLQPDGTEKQQWIGVPLVVHRRCLDPMFSISNRIYNYDMISQVVEPDDLDDRQPMGASAWIEVSGASHPHAVTEQIDLARDMVLGLFAYYNKRREEIDRTLSPALSRDERELNLRPWKAPSLSVIAPFRQIEEELQARLNAYRGFYKWTKLRIGTIHKFQGKESEAVILVLGLDPENAGASGFATAKPNMMNVAVTRAKHRLYVVGDSRVWGDVPYFRELLMEMRRRNAVWAGSEFRKAMSDAVPFYAQYAPLLKKAKRVQKNKVPVKT